MKMGLLFCVQHFRGCRYYIFFFGIVVAEVVQFHFYLFLSMFCAHLLSCMVREFVLFFFLKFLSINKHNHRKFQLRNILQPAIIGTSTRLNTTCIYGIIATKASSQSLGILHKSYRDVPSSRWSVHWWLKKICSLWQNSLRSIVMNF